MNWIRRLFQRKCNGVNRAETLAALAETEASAPVIEQRYQEAAQQRDAFRLIRHNNHFAEKIEMVLGIERELEKEQRARDRGRD